MQFHGTADRYTLNGATAVATLYSTATTATANPAVTLRTVGTNGGQAAAFTYDLARSVVYTRQGNPAWAGQERDGIAPIRSDDSSSAAVRARLGRPGQGRDPAGRRAAAAARQPDRPHERATASRCRGSGTSRAASKAVVVMTGRRSRQRRHGGPVRQLQRLSPPAARSPTGSACAARRTSTRTRPIRRAGGRATWRRASRSALHVNTGCARLDARVAAAASTRSSSTQFAATYPSAAGAEDQPDALHRVERLRHASRRSS